MVLELHNLVTNVKNKVDKKYLKKFLYDNKNNDGFYLLKKEKTPEYLFISTKGVESIKLSLVEAEITKKYMSKQFGYDNDEKIKERIAFNYKKVAKKYHNVNVSKKKINEFVNKLSPKNVDKVIRNNKVLSDLLVDVTGDNNILQDGKKIQDGGFYIWVFEKWLLRKASKGVKGFNWASVIFGSILDIIDLTLGIIGGIPGGDTAFGLSMATNLASIGFALLRFDIVSAIFDAISLIPIVGDVIGGVGNSGKVIYNLVSRVKQFKALASNNKSKIN